MARWLYRAVAGLRLLTGTRSTEVACRRRGVRWSLDLREGVQLALYLGLYERTTSKRLLELVNEGHVVIDVGANVGVHTLPLARAVGTSGRVIAIEPTDAAFTRLRVNCGLNADLIQRIVLVQAALGAPGGALEAAYHSSWPLVPAPSRHPVHLGAEQPAAQARFFTLDDLVESMGIRPALIKIDVDGRELDVLKGATNVIARHRPVVAFELCPYLLTERGQSAGDLVTFFASNGYELLEEETLQPVDGNGSQYLASIPEGGGRNLVARPTAAADRSRAERARLRNLA